MRSLPGEDARAPAKIGADSGYVGLNPPRDRIIAAIAELVAEHGYQEVTLEQISKTARVSHSTFQRLFEGKEEAFVAALKQAVDRAAALLREAVDGRPLPWPERVRRGLSALLGAAADEPALARCFFTESRAAGARALAVYDQALARLVEPLSEGRALHDRKEELSERMEEGILGGVAWYLSERLSAEEPERLPALAPELLTIIFSPYVGEAEARELARGGQVDAGGG